MWCEHSLETKQLFLGAEKSILHVLSSSSGLSTKAFNFGKERLSALAPGANDFFMGWHIGGSLGRKCFLEIMDRD